MRTLEKRLDALEQGAQPSLPTVWRWLIVGHGRTVEDVKADYVRDYGDDGDAGWIVSRMAPPAHPLYANGGAMS